MPAHADADADRWWHAGVFYQIYPRSYADSNGDGAGDLPGIIAKLDYLAQLGISGIWLSPVTVSPNRDWGYDVADYCDIDPDFGTLADLDVLVAEAGRRGIAILLDLVPNHTSDQHPWFVDGAHSGPGAEHRDWYVWADPKPDGSPPNNWVSIFGGSAWELDPASGQYYLHNFEAQQPDLNWWSEDVRGAFDDIVRFWWDRGVSGFRIDVCNMMIKDAELRDNPPATADDQQYQQFLPASGRSTYNTDRPDAHVILRHWRAVAETYQRPPLLIGETNVEQLPTLMDFYGNGTNELHGGFNFVFINAALEAGAMRTVVEETEALLPERAWPIWTGSNHDVSRLATRWAGGDPWPRSAAPCSSSSPCAARPSSTRATRSGCPTGRSRSRTCSTPWASASGPITRAGIPSAPRCPGRTRPAAASLIPASPPGSLWATSPAATWPTRRPTLDSHPALPAGPSPAAGKATTWPWARTARYPLPPAPGPSPGATGRWWP